MSDAVNHPAHYTDGKIEVIDYIEDKKLGYHLGNAVKYISRAGKKNPEKEIEDLEKAVWYIQRQIRKLKEQKAAPAKSSAGFVFADDLRRWIHTTDGAQS